MVSINLNIRITLREVEFFFLKFGLITSLKQYKLHSSSEHVLDDYNDSHMTTYLFLTKTMYGRYVFGAD